MWITTVCKVGHHLVIIFTGVEFSSDARDKQYIQQIQLIDFLHYFFITINKRPATNVTVLLFHLSKHAGTSKT